MIEVISAGLYSSFQDMGRFGYRRYGVPLSGAMDRYSASLANQLVGNDQERTVLEITLTGPVLKFNEELEVAITGAGFSPTINNLEVPLNTRILVPAKAVLKFGLAAYGLRAYLSVASGFNVDEVLDSVSYSFGVTSEVMIRKGDIFRANETLKMGSRVSASVKEDMDHFNNPEILVAKGPEYDHLSVLQKDMLENTSFKVGADSNRMAYLLEHGESLSLSEIITGPVQPGTVQLTPSGQLIVLMREAQTTGGYARIFQLTERSINRLSQKRSKAELSFKII